MPLLQGRHRESLLSLLVALAVGTLMGDALMHLLPHSLHTPHGDPAPVWRGFVATSTLILLSVLDQVMALPLPKANSSIQVMTLFGHGHSHGNAEEAKPLQEFTYLPAMEEGGVIAEKTTLTLSSVGDPPPKYTSHCPSVATSETDQVNGSRFKLTSIENTGGEHFPGILHTLFCTYGERKYLSLLKDSKAKEDQMLDRVPRWCLATPSITLPTGLP